jgi:hypothetical protein
MTDPTPSNGSLIRTFADCTDRGDLSSLPLSNYTWVETYHVPQEEHKASCTHKGGCGYFCENNVTPGNCPQGFVR